MKQEAEKILTLIRQVLEKHLPQDGHALLFGSQAREDARPDSDWDILIVLNKEKLLPADYDTVSYPLTELGWELGKQINPIMYTRKEWQDSRITPFYKNVERDSIVLV